MPEPTPSATSRLPRYRTSFVGREADVRSIERHLADTTNRLITVVGRSGAGKTRLVVEVGYGAEALGRGEPALIDVASAGIAGNVASLLAAALDTGHVAGQSAEDAIRRRLRATPALVIADDLDSIPGAAEVLLDLLSASPESVVLATARRPIGIGGERLVRLGGFAVPVAGVTATAASAAADAAALLENPAVLLYADRAAAVNPEFRLTRANVVEVAELARQLDGLPLALELGAARANILSPRAQLAALAVHSPLDLSSRSGAGRPAHHRDVRSAVAVSYEAAGESARQVLRAMSVAADDLSIDRVREIVSTLTVAAVLDALAELVDLGLADVDRRDDGEPRFRLHPTVAAFGRERLAAEDEEHDTERRYAAALLRVARETRGLPRAQALDVLATASTELHAVFARLTAAGAAEPALELAADLGPLWAHRGLFQGPGSAFEMLLGSAEQERVAVPPATLARAQLWWARLVIHGASLAEHRPAVVHRLRAAVDAARASGDEALLLFALDSVVAAVFVTGDLQATGAAVAEGLPLAERLGDRSAVRRFGYRAAMLANLGGDVATALRLAGPALESAVADHDLTDTIRVSSMLWGIPRTTPGYPVAVPSAEALLQACLDAGEVTEIGQLYASLVDQAARSGRVAEAARWAVRGLDLAQQLGAWYAGGLTTAALVIMASGARDDRIVATLHGSLTPVLAEVIVGLGPHATRYRAAIGASRERLGAEAFDQAAADATLLDRDAAIEQAAAYAQSVAAATGAAPVQAVDKLGQSRRSAATVTIPKPETPGRPERLTAREVDVLRALMTGQTNGAIAAALGLRPKTVMHHSVSIYAKLGVRGRTEATAWAYRNGLHADPDVHSRDRAAS